MSARCANPLKRLRDHARSHQVPAKAGQLQADAGQLHQYNHTRLQGSLGHKTPISANSLTNVTGICR